MVIDTKPQMPAKWINPQMVIWARERMGLSSDKVASLGDIKSEDVANWEKGKSIPTLADLQELSEVYDCPVGYFFLDVPPDEKPRLDFRGLAAEKVDSLSYESHLHLGEFLKLTDYLAELLEKADLPHEIDIETVNSNTPVKQIIDKEREKFGCTAKVREKWVSTNDAFDFWKRSIETRGAFVISLKLDAREVRGASRWDAPRVPAILVNHEDMESASGRTFTLLHEWAHLLVKHTGIVCDFRGQPNIEHYANRFAAEMLVPREEFRDYLQAQGLYEKRERWGDPVIDGIKRHFRVSRDVIAISLEYLKLAPQGFYFKKRASWELRKPFFISPQPAKKGMTLAARRLREIGQPVAALFSTAYEQGAISKLDLADVLNMKVEKAEGFINWVRENSRQPD